MFGYVRPRIDELRVREEHRYRAVYCGLCRALGKRCGPAARFLVNYDITFLCLLLTGFEAQGECTKHFCPANPLRKKNCVPLSPAMEYAADVCVILGVLSLDDKKRDARGIRKLPPAAAEAALHRSFRRAAARLPEFAELAKTQLALLGELERDRCPEMDRAADAFAFLLSHCADPLLPHEKRPAQQLLYHVGRFVYLVDALDDLAEDAESGNYNPLIARFLCQSGKLSPDDREYAVQSILQSAAMADAALALCELSQNREILENIVSLGLPAVLRAVERGEFNAKHKLKETGAV